MQLCVLCDEVVPRAQLDRDFFTNCGTMCAHHIWWTSPQLIAFQAELALYGAAPHMQHML